MPATRATASVGRPADRSTAPSSITWYPSYTGAEVDRRATEIADRPVRAPAPLAARGHEDRAQTGSWSVYRGQYTDTEPPMT